MMRGKTQNSKKLRRWLVRTHAHGSSDGALYIVIALIIAGAATALLQGASR